MEIIDDYGWNLALNEVLVLAIDHMEEARNASSDLALGVHLKMASRALRCALEIYGDRFTTKGAQPEVEK